MPRSVATKGRPVGISRAAVGRMLEEQVQRKRKREAAKAAANRERVLPVDCLVRRDPNSTRLHVVPMSPRNRPLVEAIRSALAKLPTRSVQAHPDGGWAVDEAHEWAMRKSLAAAGVRVGPTSGSAQPKQSTVICGVCSTS